MAVILKPIVANDINTGSAVVNTQGLPYSASYARQGVLINDADGATGAVHTDYDDRLDDQRQYTGDTA